MVVAVHGACVRVRACRVQDDALAVSVAYVLFVILGPIIVKATIGADAYEPPKGKDGKPIKVGDSIARLPNPLTNGDVFLSPSLHLHVHHFPLRFLP